MTITVSVLLGFLLDRMLGDPVYPFHPIRLMGGVIAKGERLLRREGQSPLQAFGLGMLLSLFLLAVSFLLPWWVLGFFYRCHWGLGLVLETILCYQILAAKALRDESMKVYEQLAAGDLPGARLALSYIVGRDTAQLEEEEIAKGAVETVAENLSDGVIAPLLYALLGGAPLGLLYKAVNTLDSMIGYRNARYAYFGKFAARLDDLANWIPARISALLMIVAAYGCGLDAGQGWRIFCRCRYRHLSPNSAQTESVCAGALGVSLSGGHYYGGVFVEKPVIGEGIRKVTKEDIRQANRLMYATAWLALVAGCGIRLLIWWR